VVILFERETFYCCRFPPVINDVILICCEPVTTLCLNEHCDWVAFHWCGVIFMVADEELSQCSVTLVITCVLFASSLDREEEHPQLSNGIYSVEIPHCVIALFLWCHVR
jgi:hypothetical protein